MLFASFASSLVLIGVVVLLDTAGRSDPNPPTGIAIGILAVGVVVALVGRLLEKPLDCTSDATLIASFRGRFFVRVASAEAPALLGFVSSVVVGAFWPYLAGLFVAAIGFARLAPTRGNLRRDQERLTASGCYRSLTRTLRFLPPPGETDPSQ